MKKSEQGILGRKEMTDEEMVAYYKESALDALLYWTNTTVSTIGANAALTLLTEMLATGIEHLVPSNQASRAEDVIFHILEQSFEMIKDSESSDVAAGELKKKTELN